jgi:hypothetical protein
MADPLNDLAIVPITSSDTNYFLRKVTGLKIDKTYSFKFQWVLDDGTLSDWSPGYQIVTPTENVPAAVTATIPATAIGNIPVTLSVFPPNTKRVDIYVIGEDYGAGKVADSFLSAGTKTISVSKAGTYQVTLIAVTPSGINGDPTNTFTVTVSASSVDTTVVPGAPSSVVVTGFNEPSDPLNRTGYANISFTAGSAAKGHSIGLWTSTPGVTDPVKIITADGTSAKVDGLFVGSQYYFRVRSFNQFNNPSAWVAPLANYPVTIPGTSLSPGAVTISGTGAPKSIVVSWGDPSSNASLVTSGGYYEVKLYANPNGTGTPIETRKAWSNQASFSGLTTGTQYWVTVQPYTAGNTPVAGSISSVTGPFVPSAIDNPDLKGDFILANNQLQVGATSVSSDIHLSAYTKTVGSLPTSGRIYIGGPETAADPTAVGLYNNSGTPFYADNLGRFSLGDKLTWSGNLATPALNIKGTVDVTGPSTFSSYVLSGATNSSFVGIGYQVPYRLSNALQTGANGLTGLVINSSGTAANSDYIKSDGTFRLADGKLTFSGGTLTVTGNIQANSIAANTDISGASGTFTGGLSVGQGTVSIITGASGNGSKVTFNSFNSLSVGDVVTITGIAQNGPFLIPASSPPQYYYTANAYNMSNVTVTDVTSSTFKVASGVVDGATQAYTSGGTVTGIGFRVSTGGIIRAASGWIGGWQIDQTQLRSFGTNSITLNPLTPKIALLQNGVEKITIDPTNGIVGPDVTINSVVAPSFILSPTGILTIRGSITSGSSITGATITGSTITSSGGGIYGGTLTINGAYFSQTAGMYIDAPVFQVATAGTDPNPTGTDAQKKAAYEAAATGFLYLGSKGTTQIGQGGSYSAQLNNVYNSLNFSINEVSPGDGYRGRGYTLFNLDAAEFRASNQHSSNYPNYSTVVAGPYGALMTGRAFYYGTSSTSATIEAAVGGKLGDIYFSTV